jgi:hypothetical protein
MLSLIFVLLSTEGTRYSFKKIKEVKAKPGKE